MNILDNKIKEMVRKDIKLPTLSNDLGRAIENISSVVDRLYANIPDKKRVSFGRVYAIKILSSHLYKLFREDNIEILNTASLIFEKSIDYKGRGVALGILSCYGQSEFKKVLNVFEKAAASDNFEIREMTQMFFRKMIKDNQKEAHNYLLKLVKSDDSNLRRFVSETLRPVVENKWFYEEPDYSLSILRHLFKEKSSYARNSVGNNLSDLARKRKDLVYKLVKKLVDSGDKNSYWIAYRACRNLVKDEPLKVMDLLGVDEYKYKKRIYRRSEH